MTDSPRSSSDLIRSGLSRSSVRPLHEFVSFLLPLLLSFNTRFLQFIFKHITAAI